MICKSPVLKFDRTCGWFQGQKEFWIICGSVLREYFDVPENARSIQFFGYSKPGKDRVKVCRAKKDTNNHLKGCLLIDGHWEFFVGDTDECIERLVDEHGTLYVECEYA